MADELKWYVLHTYSGYENKVATSIEKIVANRNMQELIREVRIPTETVVELKEVKRKEKDQDGKTVEIKEMQKVESVHKLFPGYVIINMVINDDTWILVRNVRGVTGFVGPEGKPVALTDDEMKRFGIANAELTVPFKVNDSVKIIDGPFKDFIGTVEEIDSQNGKACVIISAFGRETPVELSLEQLETVAY